MQTYDILMLIVLGGLTFYGYIKGMAWQLAYLASFVVSYFVASKFGDQFAPMFGDAAPWNKFAAMVAIYVVTSFGIWMVFRAVSGGIDRVKLDGFDHQMGAIVGFLRGLLWCLAITFVALTVVSKAVPSVRQGIIGTTSGRYIAQFIDKSEQLFPAEVHQVIGPYLQQIDQGLDPNYQGPPGGGQGFQLPNIQLPAGLLQGQQQQPNQYNNQPNGYGQQNGYAQQNNNGLPPWPNQQQQQPQQQYQQQAPAGNAWPPQNQPRYPNNNAPTMPAGWPALPPDPRR